MRKNYFLCLIALVFAFGTPTTIKAQMSGTYSIGGVSPDFATIQDACDSLKAVGVSGAVVLNIADGVYSEDVLLDSVIGVSSSNTITFQSASSDSSLVSVVGVGSAFMIRVPHVRFYHLTISCLTGNGIYLDSSDVIIDACHFISSTSYGVYGYNYSSSGNSVINDVTITNSKFNTSRGVYIYAEKINNIDISNTNFNCINNAIEIEADFWLKNVDISNGTIISTSSSTIYLYGGINEVSNVNINNLTIDCRYQSIYVYSDFLVKDIDISNVTIKGQAPAYTGNSIYLYGYVDRIENVSISKMQMDSVYTGIYIYSEGPINDFSVDSVMITATYRGVYLYSDYDNLNNPSITNASIYAGSNYGLYAYCDDDINNLTISGSMIESDQNDGAYLRCLNSNNTTISESSFIADSAGTGDDGLYINAGKDVNDVNISKTDFLGGTGFSIYADRDFNNIFIDSVTAISNYGGTSSGGYGMHLECYNGKGFNTVITDSYFMSDTGYGARIEGGDGQLDYVEVLNSTFDGGRYYGLYVEAYAGLTNAIIRNSTFNCEGAYGYGLYLYNDYNQLYNVLVDSCTINTIHYGVSVEGYYNQGLRKVTFSNNTVNVDLTTNTSSTYGYGFYSYSDGAVDDLTLTNNNFNIKANTSGYGVYAGGYYGGTKNVTIDNNDIQIDGTGSEGVYLEYAAENVKIGNNIIDTNGNSNYIDYGIYLTGEDQNTDNLIIENNHVTNSYYGIYAEYSMSGIEIKNNIFENRSNSGGDGIYIWEADAGKFEIIGNIFTNASGNSGIQIENVKLDSAMKGIVANNFFGNFNQGLYAYNNRNILFANNSFTSSGNSTLIEFDQYNRNMEFYNNILQIDTANHSTNLIEFDEPGQIKGMNYNVFNIDTSNSDLVYDGWYGNYYKDLSAWNSFSGFDGNSFMEDVAFVNDTFDLHVDCSDTTLIGGMSLPEVTTDVDGNIRATSPTIGADEILSSGDDIFSQTNIDARDYTSYIIDAGASSGSVTYSWNTGETTRMITVDSTGWYRVTITDACGAYTDSVYVEVGGYASVKEATNDLAVHIFPNPSNGEFNLTVNSGEIKTYQLRVISISGQVVHQDQINNSQKQMIDITNQPSGVYFVHLISDIGTSIVRIIKQ